MKALLSLLLVSCCVAIPQLRGAAASARTSTPTSTAAPAPTATAIPPEPADFGVIPWVNARNSAREVTARIGDTLCGTGVPVLVGGSRMTFNLSVPSEEEVPGCGREGAVVAFFVDGKRAPQTAIWRPRAFPGSVQTIELIIGPPFARFHGGLDRLLSPGQTLTPYIGNVECGYAKSNSLGTYEGAAYSVEQQAGCGVEGSQVTFKLLDALGNVVAVANEKGVWHAWDGVSDVQHLGLTFGPATVITTPPTGTGDASSGVWQPLPAALAVLALLGLATAAGGLALRTRSLMR